MNKTIFVWSRCNRKLKMNTRLEIKPEQNYSACSLNQENGCEENNQVVKDEGNEGYYQNWKSYYLLFKN